MLKSQFKIQIVLILACCCSSILKAQGPYPKNIANWSQATKDKQVEAGKKLLADLAKAIQDKKTEFSIPKGHYRFTETVSKRHCFIRLLEVENFTLDGNGSTFWFDKLATAISIYKCKNVTVKNLKLDWDPLVFSQGTIISVDPATNSFKLKIDKGYENICEKFKEATRPFRGCLFGSKTGKIKPGQVGFTVNPFWNKKDAEGNFPVKVNGFYRAKVDEIGFAAGDRFACFPRVGRTVKVECSGKVTLENITLYASSFIGFVENAGTGPTTYKKCKIIRRPGTNRLVGGNADGFNSANMTNGPILDGCEIDTIGDDFVNIHGVYSRILKQENPNTLIIQGLKTPKKEATLLIYDTKSGNQLIRTKANTESLRYKIEENMFTSTTKNWAAAKNVKIGSTVNAKKVILEKPIELKGPAYLTCEEAVGKNAIIRNCKFTGSLARGIRLQSIGTKIERNQISWCAGWGLTLAGQPGYWGESTHSKNVMVQGNSFKDTCIFRNGNPAAILVTGPNNTGNDKHIQDIKIVDNKIIRPGGNGILVEKANDVIVNSNTIEAYGDGHSKTEGNRYKNKALKEVGYGIEVLNSTNIKVGKNTITKPGKFAKSKTLVQK